MPTNTTMQAFLSHLASQPALQQQIAALQDTQAQRSPDAQMAELLRIAAAAGYAITPADLAGEVSDQELDAVAGGGGGKTEEMKYTTLTSEPGNPADLMEMMMKVLQDIRSKMPGM